jgi:hypothetical protein
MAWQIFFFFLRTPEKIPGTVSSKRTPEKIPVQFRPEHSQDKELIYDPHKISFHKATSPQYYKRVRHVLTKIPIPRRSYMMHINSLSTNPHARSTIRELNSS